MIWVVEDQQLVHHRLSGSEASSLTGGVDIPNLVKDELVVFIQVNMKLKFVIFLNKKIF